MFESVVARGVPSLSKNVHIVKIAECHHFVLLSLTLIKGYNSVQLLH